MLAGQGGRGSERHVARAKRAERGFQDRKTVEGMVGVQAGGGRGRAGRGSGPGPGERHGRKGKKARRRPNGCDTRWRSYAMPVAI